MTRAGSGTANADRNSTSPSTSSRRIAWISSSGTAATSASLGHLRHEPGELEDLFDVAYHRHTGEWCTIFHGVPLEEALRLIESETLLNPV